LPPRLCRQQSFHEWVREEIPGVNGDEGFVIPERSMAQADETQAGGTQNQHRARGFKAQLGIGIAGHRQMIHFTRDQFVVKAQGIESPFFISCEGILGYLFHAATGRS
jgi:hypothetical protein